MIHFKESTLSSRDRWSNLTRTLLIVASTSVASPAPHWILEWEWHALIHATDNHQILKFPSSINSYFTFFFFLALPLRAANVCGVVKNLLKHSSIIFPSPLFLLNNFLNLERWTCLFAFHSFCVDFMLQSLDGENLLREFEAFLSAFLSLPFVPSPPRDVCLMSP